MPTTITLTYSAYVTVTVPNDLAKKLQNDELVWNNKYGNLYYKDEKGEEQCIQGTDADIDYKRAEDYTWNDPEESDDDYEDRKNELIDKILELKKSPEGQAALKKLCLELEEEENGVSS